MRRREFLTLPAAAAAPRPPDILILLADDLGWNDVGYHGSVIRTPYIDRLASQGVRFERFCAFPLCSPTRSALMTGRNSIRTGVSYATIEPFEPHGVPLQEHFLPQTLKAAGYQTAMAGKWHLGHTRRAFFPNARGFDHSYGCLNGRIDYYTHDREGGYDWHRDGRTSHDQGYSTDLIAAEAVRRIRERDRARPLFLYVAFNAPHMPLQPPPRFMDHYARIGDGQRRAFCAITEYMDDAIGRILAEVDRNTLVLFFSDNGGPTGRGASNTPLRAGKRSTYEGGIRVPAVIRWPGVLPAGRVSRQVITVMDLLPTLAAAAGAIPRNRLPLDGRNMWPAIASGKVEPRRDLFFATGGNSMFQYALYDADWKLVRTVSRKTGQATGELFRPEEDPEEKHDLAAAEPARVREMAARIERWRALYPSDGIFDAKKTGPAPKQWAEAAR